MDLTSFLTAILTGLAAVLVAAIANTLLPGVRWARWLKRDLDIYNALPDGLEKDLWREDVEWQAERLRRYMVQHPWSAKFGGWIIVMMAIFGIVTFLLALLAWILDLSGAGTSDVSWVGLLVFGLPVAFFSIMAMDVIRGREALRTLLGPLAFALGRIRPAWGEGWFTPDIRKRPGRIPMSYYRDDHLMGLTVIQEGEQVGDVARIEHFPAEDVVVIRTDDGDVRVPFDSEHVADIDLETGTFTVTSAAEILDAEG